MIQITNLNKKYNNASSEVYAMNQINLTFQSKGMYFILGKSGSGKTTLLHAISGLDNFDSGIVLVDGKKTNTMDRHHVDSYRNTEIGIVFQEYNLIQEINVYENLAIPLRIQKWEMKSEEDIRERITKVLSFVELDGYEYRNPGELSEGERLRVAIARALIKEPKIIVADEITGVLDIKNSEMIYELLKKISAQCTVIAVTNNPQAALLYGDYVITLEDGKIQDYMEKNQKTEVEYNIVLREVQTNEIKMYSQLTKAEAGNKLNKLLDISRDKIDCELYIERVNNQNNEANEYPRKANREFKQEQSYSLPLRRTISAANMKHSQIISLAGAFMKKKKPKLVITTILLAVMLCFLTITSYISCFDGNRVFSSYFAKYHPDFITLNSKKTYVDENKKTHTRTFKKGEKYMESMERVSRGEANIGYDEEASIIKVLEDGTYKTQSNVTVLYDSGVLDKRMKMALGNLPRQEDEIAVTDYIAKMLGMDEVGGILYYKKTRLKVVGFINTDYIDYGLESKMPYEEDDKYLKYNYQYKYNVAVVNKSFMDKIQTSNVPIELSASNFIMADRETAYLNSKLRYGNMEKYAGMEIIMGRAPETDNEVLVSDTFIDTYIQDSGWTLDENKVYNFLDTGADKYDSSYDDSMNLSKNFESGVKIVGVYSTTASAKRNTRTAKKAKSAIKETDVLLTRNSYMAVAKQYYWNYYYDGQMVVMNSGNYPTVVEAASEEGLLFEEPSLSHVYSFGAMVNKMRNIVYFILFNSFLLVILMIVSCVSATINENSRNVGILRALGVKANDMMHIFKWQITFISVSAWSISIVMKILVLGMANRLYRSCLVENPHNLLEWNHGLTIAMFASTYIISFLITYITTGKLAKHKPVEILKRS